MNARESLDRTKWQCEYHVIFIPKYGRKVLDQELSRRLREVF